MLRNWEFVAYQQHCDVLQEDPVANMWLFLYADDLQFCQEKSEHCSPYMPVDGEHAV
jgi:hypothetical protein